MNDQTEISVPEFLSQLDAGWAELQAFIASLTTEQLTVPADPAGWTVKDHLMHLAVWEDGMNAVLAHQSRLDRMGISAAIWDSGDYDQINDIIQKRHRADSLASVLAALSGVHAELRGRIAAMSTADLLAPYSDYQPTSTSSDPVIWKLAGNTYEHYEEHIPWMQAIAEQA